MKYVYAVSEKQRYVTMIDLRDKTAIDLYEYDKGQLDKGEVLTWNKKNEYEFARYSSVEEILSYIDFTEDMIFVSDLTLAQSYTQLNKKEYINWESSWENCFMMMQEVSKFSCSIQAEELKCLMEE